MPSPHPSHVGLFKYSGTRYSQGRYLAFENTRKHSVWEKKIGSRYSTRDRIAQAQRHSVQAWQIFFTFYLHLAAFWAELPCDRQDKLLVTARIVIIFRIFGAQKICESYFNTQSTSDRKYYILAGHSTQNWLLFGYSLCDRIALIVIPKYLTRDRLDLWRHDLDRPSLNRHPPPTTTTRNFSKGGKVLWAPTLVYKH